MKRNIGTFSRAGFDRTLTNMPGAARSPSDAETFPTSRGELAIWTPTASLLICRFRRHGERAFATQVMRAFDALPGDRVHVFIDLEAMPTYDSELRILLTKHFGEQRKRFEQLDVLVGSKLVSMGVEVARLALTFLRSHTKRSAFTAQLDAAVAARGLVGFSSGVLRSG